MSYDLAELQRKFAALVIFGTVSEVDHAAKKLRVAEGALTTGWLPYPADTGRNYKRWRPVKVGQQFIVLCRAGDPSQGVIVGELYHNANDAPSTDENIDLIQFENGNSIQHNVATGAITITAVGNVIVNGDVIAEGISLKTHTHNKVRAGMDNTGKPQ
jgi:phage baseplate assembly protein V